MLGSLPSQKKNPGAPLLSRKAMLETLFRHLDMVRLSVGALLMIATVGCNGLIYGGSDGLTDQERDARDKWAVDALPIFQTNCVACHGGSRPMIDFLTGANDLAIRDRIKAYEPSVVNFESPQISRVLTKGQHDGPLLTPEQSAQLLEWLQAEQDSAKHDPDNPIIELATPPFVVQLCTAGLPGDATCPTNHVSISDIGSPPVSLPGAEIMFNAQALTSGLYITNLKVSGGTAGAYFEHPLFVSRPAMGAPIPDQIDRFFAMKLNEKAGAADQLDGGTAQFVGFSGTDMMEIHFKVISAFKPDTGTVKPSGCRALPQFKIAAPAFMAGTCTNCHAGNNNPNAKSTMDLSNVTSMDDAMAQLACNQVRTRVDLVNTNNSAIYLAPTPGNGTNHPFKFPDVGTFTTTFKTPVDLWVQAEKIAP